jgi:hypothetical protein
MLCNLVLIFMKNIIMVDSWFCDCGPKNSEILRSIPVVKPSFRNIYSIRWVLQIQFQITAIFTAQQSNARKTREHCAMKQLILLNHPLIQNIGRGLLDIVILAPAGGVLSTQRY